MDPRIFRPRILAILKTADLETVSAKKIRKTLQERTTQDLSGMKEELNELIKECFAAVTQPSSEEEPLSQQPRSAKKRKIKDEDPGFRAKKQEVEEVDLHVKQESRDRALAASLQASFNGERAPSRSTQSTPKKGVAKRKKPKIKSKPTVASDDDGLGPTTSLKQRRALANNPFNKLLRLSAKLEGICGEPYVSRPQVSKRVWAYIKERNLQDPNDKRYIECDDTLYDLLKTRRVHMFTMTKLLQPHMWDDGTQKQAAATVDSASDEDLDDLDVKPEAENYDNLKDEPKDGQFEAFAETEQGEQEPSGGESDGSEAQMPDGSDQGQEEAEEDDTEHAWLYESDE